MKNQILMDFNKLFAEMEKEEKKYKDWAQAIADAHYLRFIQDATIAGVILGATAWVLQSAT